MTSPPTQLPTDEQRHASLEAQVVAMRAVLEALVEIERRDNLCDPVQTAADSWREQVWTETRSALSASAKYEGKVVVDMNEWCALLKLEKDTRSFEALPEDDSALEPAAERICKNLARLDALREGGGK